VTLALQPSPSADIVEHAVYRRIAGEDKWTTIWHGDARTQASYTDSSAVDGTLYEYALIATDDAGHHSPLSNIVSGARLATGAATPVDGVTPVVDKSRKGIVLRWNGAAPSGARIYVYRAAADGQLALYRSLDAGASEFVDSEILAGTTYRYGLKTVTDRGDESRMVTTAGVRYE
jgi:fibronectin type 3 domain-containing protein